jgi:hypothetical protein
MIRTPGLFDLDDRYRKLSEVADLLAQLSRLINFEDPGQSPPSKEGPQLVAKGRRP